MLHFILLVVALVIFIRMLPYIAKSCLHILLILIIIAIAFSMFSK